jgi:hypothetical protein
MQIDAKDTSWRERYLLAVQRKGTGQNGTTDENNGKEMRESS